MDDTIEIDPLTRLAIKHGTDKWGPHFYTPVYHGLFSHLRDRPIRLLEIGVGGYGFQKIGGASLAMWADYFPNGRIVGIDSEEKRLDCGPQVTILKGSQTDTAFLEGICAAHGPFDIIIDDGSHIPTHVVTSFLALFPKMADRGLYVIEDVQTCFWPLYGGSVLHGGATMALVRSLLEELNHAEIKVQDPKRKFRNIAQWIRAIQAFHNIFVFEKGDNDEPSVANYAFDNPHVARAVKAIEAELAREPTPEGTANLVNVYLLGSRLETAQQLVDEGLEKWPRNPTLLLVAHNLATVCRQPRQALDFLDRLLEIEPNNASLVEMAAKARSELAAQSTVASPMAR